MTVVLGLLATTGIMIFGALSWIAARQAARSSSNSADAANSMAEIARRQEHASLEPDLKITPVPEGGGNGQIDHLPAGPAGIDRLDELGVEIRDDIPNRTPIAAGGPTQEQLDQQVFSPFRFAHGIDNQHGPRDAMWPELERASWRRSSWSPPTRRRGALATARPQRRRLTGSGTSGMPRHPIRLKFTCRRKGFAPWFIPKDVSTTAPESPST
jgi:hypothetical protein